MASDACNGARALFAQVGVPGGSGLAVQLIAPRTTAREGGDTDNGKEDSQGRQEKGRQEAVSQPRPIRKRGAIAAPLFLFEERGHGEELESTEKN